MSEPTLPNIDQSPAAFDTEHQNLLVVQKVDSDNNGNIVPDRPASEAVRRPIAKLGNLYDGLVRLFQRRLAEFPDVQTLKALGTDDGIVAGMKVRIAATGNVWVAQAAGLTTSTSTWEPGNSEWYVDDYGARADGTTQSGALINACIQDAGPSALVTYDNGTYLCEVTVLFDQAGQTHRGTGWALSTGTWLKFDNTVATNQPVVKISSAYRVTLEEIRIGYSTTSLSAGADGVLFTGYCGFPTLRNVLIDKVARVIATDTASPTTYWNERFENVYGSGFTTYGIYHVPVGAANSGGIWHVYLTNTGYASLRPTRALHIEGLRASQFKVNVEHSYYLESNATAPVYITGSEIEGMIHFEEVTSDTDVGGFDNSLIAVNGPAKVRLFVSVEAIHAVDSSASGGRYLSLVRVTNHPEVEIDGVVRETTGNFAAGTTFWKLRGSAGNSYASGCRLKVGRIPTDTAFATTSSGMNLQDAEQSAVVLLDGESYQHTPLIRSVASDGALTFVHADRTVLLEGSTTGTKAATMITSGVKVGKRLRVKLEAASGGSYTIAATNNGSSGTVTLDAADEGVELEWDGTVWQVLQLIGGATFA